MSRIGKMPITIPSGVSVSQKEGVVSVKGPKGEISKSFLEDIDITVGENVVTLKPATLTPLAKSLWGTYSAHINNMIKGVVDGHERKLVVSGVGYKAEASGEKLILSVGYSHKVEMQIPKGLTVSVQKNVITISGHDKELVTSFAALVREVRKPEPYKGKGIRYENEVVKIKQGKKAAGKEE